MYKEKYKARRAVTQVHRIIIAAVVLVTIVAGNYYWGARHQMDNGLRYVAPEEVGWSS